MTTEIPMASDREALEREQREYYPFRIGQRVRLSEHGEMNLHLRKRPEKGPVKGTITSLGPSRLTVRVWVDGYAGPTAYYAGFWRPVR